MILIIIMILAPVHAEEKKIKVKFFFAEDCPHCKKVEGYFEGLKKEYDNALDIEMTDVFTSKGYKEFKEYGFVMTPGIVFNDGYRNDRCVYSQGIQGVQGVWLCYDTRNRVQRPDKN